MNIKDVKLAPMSYWVKSDKPTEYHDDNGTYYELWGDTLAGGGYDTDTITDVKYNIVRD